MNKTRRNFLKLTGLAGAGYLSGCSSLDRWVNGESRDEQDKVVILGGGVAGLYAAYLLSQAKIPFRVFEAQTRVGGRILTLNDFNESSQVADLGAEILSASDERSLSLLKELRIATESQAMLPTVFVKGQKVKPVQLETSLRKLQKIFFKLEQEAYSQSHQILIAKNKSLYPKAQQLDEMSAREFLKRIRSQLDELQVELIEHWGNFRFSTPLETLSALALVEEGSRGFGREWLRVSGGLSLLPQSLFDRIAGVVPGRFARLEHSLRSVEMRDAHFLLTFSNAGNEIEIKARHVICTLPLKVLGQIKGIDQLAFASHQKEFIAKTQSAQITKLAVTQAEQYWRKEQIEPLQWLERETWSLSSPWKSSSLARPKNVLSVTFSGARGQQGGPHLIDLAKSLLGSALQNKTIVYENEWAIQNWGKIKTAGGAGTFLSPGMAIFRDDLFVAEDFGTRWVLAGEAFSAKQQGRVEGALNSAADAAQYFIKKLKN
jgi:monoamine oxidase